MRYFFDIFDGDHWSKDDRGIECNDDLGARQQAVLTLIEMARDYIPADGANMDLAVRVRHASQMAFTVNLDFSTEAGPGLNDPSVIQGHDEMA